MPPSLSRPDSIGVPLPATPAQVARLVAAVSSDRRALRIGKDNESAGWCDTAAALASQAAFAVVCRENVVALDADTPSAVAAVARLHAWALEHNLLPVRVASGGPGREHMFVAVPDPGLRAQLAGMARSAGIDVRSRTPIRPPGVPHRSGVPSVLISPSSWDDAAAALELGDPLVSSLAGLSRRLMVLIRDGDVEGRYRHDDGTPDGSRLVLAICNLAYAEGLDAGRLFRLLRHKDHVGGRSLRRRLAQRGPRHAQAWFDITWRKAQDSPTRRPASAPMDPVVVADVLDRLDWYASQPHPGQTGNSDVAVFTAAVSLVLRWGRGPAAPLSVRELALTSGKDTKTVMAALKRLSAQGVLVRVEDAHLDAAAVWEVTRDVPTPIPVGVGGRGGVGELRDLLEHDAMAAGALGAGGFRVLAMLSSDPQSVRELAERSGMHPGTIRRHVVRLSSAGLIEESGDGTWVRHHSGAQLRPVLDGVAQLRLTWGRHASRRAKFDAERTELRRILISGDENQVVRLVLGQRRRAFAYVRVPSIVANRSYAA